MPTLRLGSLPLVARIGLSGIVLAIALGLWASLEHLRHHHQDRDGEAGVSLDDLRGAYHGLAASARLAAALQRGHPDELAGTALPTGERNALLSWLGSERVSEHYDDPDRGELAPAEILARGCLGCHARGAPPERRAEPPLEYWDDVSKLAFARNIDATPREILAVSTHTHALSMAVLTLALAGLLACTRWPDGLKSALLGLGGAALAVDLACWWLARSSEPLVVVLAAAGGLWLASQALALALVLLELWLPPRGRA